MTWLIAIASAAVGYFFGFARERLRADERHQAQLQLARSATTVAEAELLCVKLELARLKRVYPFDREET